MSPDTVAVLDALNKYGLVIVGVELTFIFCLALSALFVIRKYMTAIYEHAIQDSLLQEARHFQSQIWQTTTGVRSWLAGNLTSTDINSAVTKVLYEGRSALDERQRSALGEVDNFCSVLIRLKMLRNLPTAGDNHINAIIKNNIESLGYSFWVRKILDNEALSQYVAANWPSLSEVRIRVFWRGVGAKISRALFGLNRRISFTP